MKALFILRKLKKRCLDFDYDRLVEEAIAELEALKYNYEAQEIMLKDKEMWIRGLEYKLKDLQC